MSDTHQPAAEPAADRLAEIGRPTAEEPTSWTGTLTVTYSARQSACVGCRVVGTWDEIAAHVLVCPDHPIGRLTRERDEARAELAALREAAGGLQVALERCSDALVRVQNARIAGAGNRHPLAEPNVVELAAKLQTLRHESMIVEVCSADNAARVAMERWDDILAATPAPAQEGDE